METFRFQPGETPVSNQPAACGHRHTVDIAQAMTDTAHEVADTDWHLDRLYNFAPALGVGFLAASQSRYVIDLNRDPKGHALYRGGDNTELCPTSAFDFSPLYREGCEPDAVEMRRRLSTYWHPYHRQLAAELEALKERFGIAILFDAPLDKTDRSPPLRGTTRRLQSWNRRWHQRQSASFRPSYERPVVVRPIFDGARSAVQGWLHHPAIRQARGQYPRRSTATEPSYLYGRSGPLQISQ